jgi:hypothetical protein
MDGTRLMDQINPRDNRLGPSDVEFETTIIPIWLAKMEYYPGYTPPFLDEFGLELIFNPNADFIGNKNPGPGNYEHGIWSTNTLIPALNGRSGAVQYNIEEPDSWDSEGHEFAVRIKGTLPDATYFTLNYFNGVDNDFLFETDPDAGLIRPTDKVDDKGLRIWEPLMRGYYPDKEYVGFTFARDFESLYIKSLGGVAPLVRAEFIYEFDSGFGKTDGTNFDISSDQQRDVIFWGLGVEWKFKWNLLNPRRYFSLTPQFQHRHIRDYPDDGSYLQLPGGPTVAENNYNIYVNLMTYYMHDKLTPMLIFIRDIHSDVSDLVSSGSVKYDMWLFKLLYEPNHIWSYKFQLTYMFNDGQVDARGMDVNNNVSFTVQYQF